MLLIVASFAIMPSCHSYIQHSQPLTLQQQRRQARDIKFRSSRILAFENVEPALHAPLRRIVKGRLLHQQLANEGGLCLPSGKVEAFKNFKQGNISKSSYQAARAMLHNADEAKHAIVCQPKAWSQPKSGGWSLVDIAQSLCPPLESNLNIWSGRDSWEDLSDDVDANVSTLPAASCLSPPVARESFVQCAAVSSSKEEAFGDIGNDVETPLSFLPPLRVVPLGSGAVGTRPACVAPARVVNGTPMQMSPDASEFVPSSSETGCDLLPTIGAQLDFLLQSLCTQLGACLMALSTNGEHSLKSGEMMKRT